jgi:hypothetical protein
VFQGAMYSGTVQTDLSWDNHHIGIKEHLESPYQGFIVFFSRDFFPINQKACFITRQLEGLSSLVACEIMAYHCSLKAG